MYMAFTASLMSWGERRGTRGDGVSWLTISPHCSHSSHEIFVSYLIWRSALFALALFGGVAMVQMSRAEAPETRYHNKLLYRRDRVVSVI